MTISTFMVLLLLTFGQILALSIGFLVLWVAGEFEDTGAPREQLTAQDSTGVRRFIRASASGFVLRWRRHVPAFPSSWVREHRSLIAGCVLLIAAVSVFVSVGKLKRWQIAQFLPPSFTDGSKSSPP
jgi:hypothetical protein